MFQYLAGKDGDAGLFILGGRAALPEVDVVPDTATAMVITTSVMTQGQADILDSSPTPG